jgi:hypothetical protein
MSAEAEAAAAAELRMLAGLLHALESRPTITFSSSRGRVVVRVYCRSLHAVFVAAGP